MKKSYAFITAFCLLSLTNEAEASVTDTAQVEHLSLWNSLRVSESLNPALRSAMFVSSLSQLTLGMDGRKQSEAFVEEDGTGFLHTLVGVDTYLRLSDKTAVWGKASYTAGTNHDVRWRSTADYALLRPYILADTLGGDTKGECYRFAGGYGTRLGRFCLGGEMEFRAEQEYRERDPRMRGIVTDLTLRTGCAYTIGIYDIGLAVETNIYRQTNSVAFYNEDGVIPEYQLTGLGSDYTRFSGDKRSLYHDGGGTAIRLNLVPHACRGIYADLMLCEHHYERKLADFNAMPLTMLTKERAEMSLGWRQKKGGANSAVFSGVKLARHVGDENVGGEAYGGSYPTIATLSMYHYRLTDAYLGALYGRASWNVIAVGGYRTESEEYAYPLRRMEHTDAYAEVDAQCFLMQRRAVRLMLDAQAQHSTSLRSTVTMPYANMKPSFTDMIRHKERYLKADFTTLAIHLRADYDMPRTTYGLYADAGMSYTACSVGSHQTGARLAIGLCF